VALDVATSDWRAIAARADRYSGRDLMQVCREASMRPLRELFQHRMLETTAASSRQVRQQGQLVTAAVAAFARGGSQRRVRRELQRWKREQRAEWCDVEGVLQQAWEQHEAATRAPVGGGAAARPAGQGSGMASSSGSGEGSSSGSGSGSVGASSMATAAAAAACGGLSRASSQLLLDQAGGAAADRVIASPCSSMASTAPAACACSPPPQQQQRQQEPRPTCGDCSGGQAKQADADTAAAATQRCSTPAALCSHPIDEDAACAPAAAPAAAAQQPAPDGAGGDGSGAPAAAAQQPAPPVKCGRRAAQGSSATAAAAAGEKWTLEELMAMPADAVRAVTCADFEWALEHVAATDFNMSGRFEEWGNQHGSGAKREPTTNYAMSMYM
jgi:hypothetical protein